MTKSKKLVLLLLIILLLLAKPVVSGKEKTNSTSIENFSENNFIDSNDSMLKIEIVTPQENESVNSMIVVKGRLSQDLKKNEHLWIAVKPYKSINDWWPQSGGPIEPIHREFEGYAFLGGTENDKFEIGIIVVGDDLNEKIMDWENVSRRLNRWAPITQKYAGKPDKNSGYLPLISKNEIESHKYAKVTVILCHGIVDIYVINSAGKAVKGAIVTVDGNPIGNTNSDGHLQINLPFGNRSTIQASAIANGTVNKAIMQIGTDTKYQKIFMQMQ